MNSRAKLVLAAAFCALAVAGIINGPIESWLCAALALTLATGVALPRLTMRLLLLSVSCDLVLTVRVADAFTLRLAHLCAALLAIRLVVDRYRSGLPWRIPRRALQPLALYLLVAAISSARSENLGKSVGYWAWAAFDLLALFGLLVESARTDAAFRFLARWWVAGAAVAAVMGATQLAMGFAHLPVPLLRQTVGDYPRISGFNYEPAYFALYLESVAAPVLLYGLVARRRGIAMLGGALLFPAALSMSRSGWLGMGLLLGYAMLRLFLSGRRLAALGMLLITGTSVTTVMVAFPADFLSEAPKMAAMALDADEPSSSAPRLSMLEQGRRVFAASPLLGVGLGGYGGYVQAHPELMLPGQGDDPDHIVTTNLWLELASETGVVGVFAILWFLLALGVALIQVIRLGAPDDAALAEAFLVGVLLVFGVLYEFNQTLWRLDVWVLLALAWSVPVRAALSREEPQPSAAAPAPLGAALAA